MRKIFILLPLFFLNYSYSSDKLNISLIRENAAKTFQIISTPDLDRDLKVDQIGAFFNFLTSQCEINCDELIVELKRINNSFNFQKIEDEYKVLINKHNIPSEITNHTDKLLLSLNNSEFLEQFQEFFKKSDSKQLKYRINTSIEMLRYLVAIEELTLIEYFKKEDAFEKALLVQKSILNYKKQITAIVSIGKIVTKYADDFSEIPAKEMKSIVNSINDLGVFYMKIAQSISNNQLLFEKEQRSFLKHFQDDIKPMEAHEVIDVIVEEFGKHPSEIFLDFDAKNPLATGTIAQTYQAKIKTLFGTKEIIIKVQRPGLKKVLNQNKKLNLVIVKAFKILGDQEIAPFIDFIAEQIIGLSDAFEMELDFRKEKKALQRFKSFFTFNRKIIIPKVFGDYSTKRVLTMEKIKGSNIDTYIKEFQGVNNKKVRKVYDVLLSSFLKQTFLLGELHADMHPGNILVTDKQKIGLIDFGQTFETKGLLTKPIQLFYGLLTGDSFLVANALMDSAKLGRKFNKVKFQEMINEELLEKGLKPTSLIKLLMDKDNIRESHNSEAVFEALREILNKSIKRYDYLPSSKFFQLARTTTPVISTLIEMANILDEKAIQKKLIFTALTYSPIILTSFLKNSFSLKLKRLIASVRSKTNEFKVNCERFFDISLGKIKL